MRHPRGGHEASLLARLLGPVQDSLDLGGAGLGAHVQVPDAVVVSHGVPGGLDPGVHGEGSGGTVGDHVVRVVRLLQDNILRQYEMSSLIMNLTMLRPV